MQKILFYTLTTLVLGILIALIIIPFFRKIKMGQYVRDDGPKSHLIKAGTPTMGGLIFIIPFIIVGLSFNYINKNYLFILTSLVGFGLIGFIDDYFKLIMKRSLGLKAYQKICLQSFMVVIMLVYMFVNLQDFNQIYIPFMGSNKLAMGFLYYPLIVLVILGTVNSVNLTDGLDGLAASVTLIISLFFALISYRLGNEGVFVSSLCMVGGLIAFLFFNIKPAKIFMGDMGSLALGGYVAAVSIVLKIPIYIILFGIIYLIEALSVIIQVAYFKKTGKRFFKMAPIHHHFELLNYEPNTIVIIFDGVTLVACMIAYLLIQ